MLLTQNTIDINYPIPLSQMTALHVSSMFGHVDVVKNLVFSNVEIDLNAKSVDGETALHLAARKGHIEVQ